MLSIKTRWIFFFFTDGVDYKKLFHSLIHKTTFPLKLSNNANVTDDAKLWIAGLNYISYAGKQVF
jgi:hypothetical protein